MLYDLDALVLVPAHWHIVPDQPRTVDVVIIHSAEAAELPSTAEALGQYFRSHPDILGHFVDGVWVQRKASTHLGIDNDSVGYYVDFDHVAFAAGGVNHNGIHLEHAGFARQTREEWLDEYSLPMLKLSARVTAALCVRYDIPAVWLAPDDLLRGRRGISTHLNAVIAFGGNHWDPGYQFPEDVYLQFVRNEIAEQVTTMASLTVHDAELREALLGHPAVWDFTYLPADGQAVNGSRCVSYLVLRSVSVGHDQEVEVYFDGVPVPNVIVPGDGRTIALAVSRAGLASVVGTGLVAKARELWL